MRILAKNLLILASAGSGKTFQLGNRVIGLVANGVPPERIVALTFTRKAAGEFSDSVLKKLADAAAIPAQAEQLRKDLDHTDADFAETLERVVKALPDFTLGTMDSYFARIVRGFQYELGLAGGRFELIEGPRADAAVDAVLASVLGNALTEAHRDEFHHAFRRATIGREDRGVLAALRDFATHWHERFREQSNIVWGPELTSLEPGEWEKQKTALAAAAHRGLDSIEYSIPSQQASLESAIDFITNHVIGSGTLGSGAPTLVKSILDAVVEQNSPGLRVKFRKEFTITGPTADALRAMVTLAAECELAAALTRTRAVREVISHFDELCQQRLRSRGLLGFSDVKVLMGEWATSEEARLRRESVDFRLDARTDHWLLDEFQDTSGADWHGLLPLIDEAAADPEGSVFIVGDRKQAIYAWRGGDVSLFNGVIDRYRGNLEIETMANSYRSSPEVLALVNHVCGDLETLGRLFGDAASRWQWETHVSANHLRAPEKAGHARVEVVGKWEERLERLSEILEQLDVRNRTMTCGILLRSNDKVREVAEHLRSSGFDVVEEGRREPAKDNPVGAALHQLVRWLANPADPFARRTLEMSPLAAILLERHGPSWRAAWSNIHDLVSRDGFAVTLGSLIAAPSEQWSDFGRSRANDLITALADFDATGAVSARDAADWLDRLQVSQNPGLADVQVMTVHSSKGLGFDVVILPEIPKDGIPQAQRFNIAQGPGWLTETPAQWARKAIPELAAAESRWADEQRYEAFCTLYVALTRAKRGLYVLLEPPSKSADPESPSLANWIATSITSESTPGTAFEQGSFDWTQSMPMLDESPAANPIPGLGPAVPKRGKSTPSSSKSAATRAVGHSSGGMDYGNEVHQLLESVAWHDESPADLPESLAGSAVARLLESPQLAPVFRKNNRAVALLREQPVDAIIDGKHLTGIIDRLHLHHDANGNVTRAEIIDFKTDDVAGTDELVARYSGQMTAYRNAIARIHPDAEVSCALLSVPHACLVGVSP
ncbi:MAG: UvrD-helicase domain-containing protein [Verrucomicrobiales bacterium]